jgi:hypothetical protein
VHNVAGEADPIYGYLKEENEDAYLSELGKNMMILRKEKPRFRLLFLKKHLTKKFIRL